MKVEIVLGDEFKHQFKRLAKKYPSLKDDFITFKKELADKPFQGSDLGNPHPYTPSLSPSPARGMFRFGNWNPLSVCLYCQCPRLRMGRELAASLQINLN